MRLTFLGTGAGEAYPGFWCQCRNCAYAREKGGRNIRGNSCAMIDDDVLIDMNSHCFDMLNALRLSPARIRLLLVTHPHRDHFAPQLLTQRAMPLSWAGLSPEEAQTRVSPCFTDLPLLHIYGNTFVRKALECTPRLMERREECRISFHEIRDGVEERFEDIRFVPVRSIHGGQRGFAHSYIVSRGESTLLYASDAGGYEPEMLEILLAHKYDCVILEGTFGLGAKVDAHKNLEKNREMLALFNRAGVWKRGPNLHITHICPHWAPPHDIYAPMLEKEGMVAAYDGKRIEI